MSEPSSVRLLTDTVVGAIIGGSIGVSGTIAVLIFEYRKWKKGLQLDHFRRRRKRMEELFARIYKSIGESFEKAGETETQEFSIDTQGDIEFLCPPEVRDKIRENMTLDPAKDRIDAIRGSLASISIQMKDYLTKIDRQIEKELGVAKSGNNSDPS